MFYIQPPGDDATEEAREDWARRECEAIMQDLADREIGIRVARAGLVWKVPLCHDGYDY